MSGFGVTPAELAAGDVFVHEAAHRARQAVGGLRLEAAELLGGGWQGGAAAAFRSAWAGWLSGALLAVEALDELARLTGAAGTSYVGTDETVRTAAVGTPA